MAHPLGAVARHHPRRHPAATLDGTRPAGPLPFRTRHEDDAPMGGHHARHGADETRSMRRLAAAVIIPIAVVTLAALAWLWPTEGVAVVAQ